MSLALVASLAGCAPRACNDPDDGILADVDLLIGESPAASRSAMARLVDRGSVAIPMLETGLPRGDEVGRRKIVRTLVKIGHPEVRPILEHLSERDPDPEVRKAAKGGLRALVAP